MTQAYAIYCYSVKRQSHIQQRVTEKGLVDILYSRPAKQMANCGTVCSL